MSKQSEAKSLQQYVSKALPAVCGACDHLRSERVCTNQRYVSEWVKPYYVEKNLRCGIGDFAVKKMGTCNRFDRRPSAPQGTAAGGGGER